MVYNSVKFSDESPKHDFDTVKSTCYCAAKLMYGYFAMHKLTVAFLMMCYVTFGAIVSAQASAVDNLGDEKQAPQLLHILCGYSDLATASSSAGNSLLHRSRTNGRCQSGLASLRKSTYSWPSAELNGMDDSFLVKKVDIELRMREENLEIEQLWRKTQHAEDADVPLPQSLYFLLAGLIGVVVAGRARQDA